MILRERRNFFEITTKPINRDHGCHSFLALMLIVDLAFCKPVLLKEKEVVPLILPEPAEILI